MKRNERKVLWLFFEDWGESSTFLFKFVFSKNNVEKTVITL